MKVYYLHMKNANTNYPINIIKINKENLQKFKEDADKDKRYITYDIKETVAKSITLDNTLYAINVYDTIEIKETYHADKENLTYNDFIKKELGID